MQEDIGDDVTGPGPDLSRAADISFFSHEAFVEISGTPAISVAIRDDDDLVVGIDGVELDVPRDRVPDVPEAVWDGRARVHHPMTPVLCVAVPGDETYSEAVLTWTPWLMSVTRTRPSRPGGLLRRLIGRDGDSAP